MNDDMHFPAVAADWNFGDLLDATAANIPGDRPALIHGNRMIDWASFDAHTNSLARAMIEGGLQVGDRVAVLARNIPEYIEIAAAAFKARVTYVNINYRYVTDEIAYVLRDSGARAIFYQNEFADVLAPLLDAMPVSVAIDGRDGRYAEMISGDASPLTIKRSAEDGYLIYTGGTTGRPKGVYWRGGDARAVQLESPTVKTVMRTMADHIRFVRENPLPGRVVPACPLMHGAGLNSSTAELVGGGTVVLLESAAFDAVELWNAVETHRVSRVLIVGDVFARPMARALETAPERWDLSSMRVISSAGLMWSEEVKAMLIAAIPQVALVDILGASEASGFGYSIVTAQASTPTGFFDIGPNAVIIEMETDRVLADDEPGEGWLARRPPYSMGYHGDPEKTAATFRVIDGVRYAIPGDVAQRGDDGRVRLIGRGNLCINSGGEKIFPEEVEEALKLQPGIDDALVLGVPDPVWGKAVAALVLTSDGFDESRTREGLKRMLAAYKVPKHLFVVAELPRHASGKSDYRRAEAAMAALLS